MAGPPGASHRARPSTATGNRPRTTPWGRALPLRSTGQRELACFNLAVSGPAWGHRDALAALVDQAVTVRDIVTEDLVVVASSATPAEVRSLLDAQDFDLVGVDSSGDRIADRVVTRDDLVDAASVWKASKPLPVENVVEKSMPLGSLLTLLVSRPHVFVLDEYRVRHIVTHADLAHPAVGLVFLAYLLALERVLLTLAVRRLGTSWFDRLTADQQAARHDALHPEATAEHRTRP